MKFKLASQEKEKIKKNLIEIIQNKEEVIFAYLHGSFLINGFNDIDLAFFVNGIEDILDYEISVSLEIEKKIHFPIDVKVLNSAPLGFKYEVTKGELLFSRDEEIRTDFLEKVWHQYLDFKPIEKEILMDMMD
ncbi:MAG: nucleotidyltransferase domain-containing protein [Candidatus Methanoperedens sp.]|nr:nucleotidyltransferase domain-containing protein [Candidatus Methanoperedens sp.]